MSRATTNAELLSIVRDFVCVADLCQGSKKVRDPGFAESKVWNLDGSWTLHVLFAVGLWKPRTSNCVMPQDPGNPGPQDLDMQ